MQRLRGDVGAVGPPDRPELAIKLDTSEVGRIAQRLKHTAPVPRRCVDLAADTVIERKAKPMLADNVDLDNPMQMSRQLQWSRC